MFETIDRHAPADATHRLAVAVLAAVAGILAIGDALNVIYFPMFQLGLPDTPLANMVVLLLGAALLVTTYRLVQLSIDDPALGAPGLVQSTADAGGFDDREPEQILKARYARGELDESEFETMLAHLDGYDVSDDDEFADARDYAENHELNQRQTLVD